MYQIETGVKKSGLLWEGKRVGTFLYHLGFTQEQKKSPNDKVELCLTSGIINFKQIFTGKVSLSQGFLKLVIIKV
jgi:hypothetical protein